MGELRIACEHDQCDFYIDGGRNRCPGSRVPTRAEWVAYGEEQGWINYEAASVAYYANHNTGKDHYLAVVDAALGGDQ